MGAPTKFDDWVRRWMELADFPGPELPEPEQRIADVIELWRATIPGHGQWQRDKGRDKRLLDPNRRYCRGDNHPEEHRPGERAIEYDILNDEAAKMNMECLGAALVDGVNAVPLTKDEAGGKAGNVEADMLLLVRGEFSQYRLLLVEVKVESNNAWYAAVENLRQLRLFKEAVEPQRLFHYRWPELALPEDLPVTGVVLGPEAFFSAKGQKRASVKPTVRLLNRMREEDQVDIRLATWDPDCMKPR